MNDKDARDIAHLRRLANEADPVPEAVYAAAKAAYTTRDLDGELAALVADSAAAEATLAFDAVRTGPRQPVEPRLLSFRGAVSRSSWKSVSRPTSCVRLARLVERSRRAASSNAPTGASRIWMWTSLGGSWSSECHRVRPGCGAERSLESGC